MDFVAIFFVLVAAVVVGELKYRSLFQLSKNCCECLFDCTCLLNSNNQKIGLLKYKVCEVKR